MFAEGNILETRIVHDGMHMLRKAISVPGGVAHYVLGSAYLMVHLFTHERRARAVLEDPADG